MGRSCEFGLSHLVMYINHSLTVRWTRFCSICMSSHINILDIVKSKNYLKKCNISWLTRKAASVVNISIVKKFFRAKGNLVVAKFSSLPHSLCNFEFRLTQLRSKWGLILNATSDTSGWGPQTILTSNLQ